MFKNITWDQMSSVFHRLLMFAFGYLTAKGVLTEEQAVAIAGAMLTLGGVAWGWWFNRRTAVIASAAAIPGATVIAPPDIAHSIPSPDVVANTEFKVVPQ